MTLKIAVLLGDLHDYTGAPCTTRDTDPADFDTEHYGISVGERRALAIHVAHIDRTYCQPCPHRTACQQRATTDNAQHTIRGGIHFNARGNPDTNLAVPDDRACEDCGIAIPDRVPSGQKSSARWCKACKPRAGFAAPKKEAA